MKHDKFEPLNLTDAAREKIACFMADDPRKMGKGGVGGHLTKDRNGELVFLK